MFRALFVSQNAVYGLMGIFLFLLTGYSARCTKAPQQLLDLSLILEGLGRNERLIILQGFIAIRQS